MSTSDNHAANIAEQYRIQEAIVAAIPRSAKPFNVLAALAGVSFSLAKIYQSADGKNKHDESTPRGGEG